MFIFENVFGHHHKDFDFCRDRGCGMKLNVEGSGHFDGIYQLEQGYHNNGKRGIHDISIEFPGWPVIIPATLGQIPWY